MILRTLFLLTAVVFPAWGDLQAVELPNIIYIIADDLGYGETSIQNPETDVPTPHIDSIAQNGVLFTDGYVSAPFCDLVSNLILSVPEMRKRMPASHRRKRRLLTGSRMKRVTPLR